MASGCYAESMDMIPTLYPQKLVLLEGPRPFLRRALPAILASLPLTAPVRIFDGGNTFNFHEVARMLRRITPNVEERLKSIQIARAFTCYQVLSLLAGAPADGAPTLVLEPAATFYDESVNLPERKQLFKQSLNHLERLNRLAPVAVTFAIHPMPEPDEWLRRLEQRAADIWRMDIPPGPVQPRLL